jgi:hypothetical protein
VEFLFLLLLSFCFFFLAGEHAAGCVRGGRRCREGHAGDPVGEDALREGSVPGDEDEELQELPEPKLRPGGCFAGITHLSVLYFQDQCLTKITVDFNTNGRMLNSMIHNANMAQWYKYNAHEHHVRDEVI